MRKIGNFEFPEGAEWEGQGNFSFRRETIKRTTDGGIVVIAQALTKGEPIKISFQKEYCWLSFDQAQQLRQMSRAVGQTYLLEWDLIIEQVMFTGDVALQKLQGISEPEHDFYIGEINLISI
jgi:hypothetical protein